MAAKTIHSSRLAFKAEATQGTGPTTWDDEQQIDHIAVDVSKIAQSLIADPTLETTINASGGRTMIKGLRSCEMPASLKLTGSGVTTSAQLDMSGITPPPSVSTLVWTTRTPMLPSSGRSIASLPKYSTP